MMIPRWMKASPAASTDTEAEAISLLSEHEEKIQDTSGAGERAIAVSIVAISNHISRSAEVASKRVSIIVS